MRDCDKCFEDAFENIFDKEKATIENDIRNIINRNHASEPSNDEIIEIIDDIKQRIKPSLKEWYFKQTIPDAIDMRNTTVNQAVGTMPASIKCKS